MTIIAAGAIVYKAGRGFLLIRNRDYWEFPKGRADEADADIMATALREVGEETGLTDVKLIDGFKEEENFRVLRGPKTVTYFLAQTAQEPKLSHEHRGYCWCTVREAESFIRYEVKRAVLRKAVAFLKEKGLLDENDVGVALARPRRKQRRGGARTKTASGTNGASRSRSTNSKSK
jgi:8-oxo-dGTP pyrophosphatase MutT (NUDIX family)